MTYLEQLFAARAAILTAISTVPGAGAFENYSLDGESSGAADWAEKLMKIEDLILREQNRVSGRRELRVVLGRRYVGWHR